MPNLGDWVEWPIDLYGFQVKQKNISSKVYMFPAISKHTSSKVPTITIDSAQKNVFLLVMSGKNPHHILDSNA